MAEQEHVKIPVGPEYGPKGYDETFARIVYGLGDELDQDFNGGEGRSGKGWEMINACPWMANPLRRAHEADPENGVDKALAILHEFNPDFHLERSQETRDEVAALRRAAGQQGEKRTWGTP